MKNSLLVVIFGVIISAIKADVIINKARLFTKDLHNSIRDRAIDALREKRDKKISFRSFRDYNTHLHKETLNAEDVAVAEYHAVCDANSNGVLEKGEVFIAAARPAYYQRINQTNDRHVRRNWQI